MAGVVCFSCDRIRFRVLTDVCKLSLALLFIISQLCLFQANVVKLCTFLPQDSPIIILYKTLGFFRLCETEYLALNQIGRAHV